ncbi:hypothetical protein HDV00_002200 [Rhizophlyctis rosea]|nr:hypothetical protein HDV00_002200 [Rhizophlyctis rosea]
MSRNDDGVVRDLVYAHRNIPVEQCKYTALGVQLDGQAIVSRTDKSASFLDSVFTETTIRPITNIGYISHTKSATIAHAIHPPSAHDAVNTVRASRFQLEDWNSRNTIMRVADLNFHTETILMHIYHSHILLFMRESNRPYHQIISLQDPSSRFVPLADSLQSSRLISLGFNGIILAYLWDRHSEGTDRAYLTLIHLESQQTVASTTLSTNSQTLTLSTSRFHVFICTDQQCHVYNLAARHLYSFNLRELWDMGFFLSPRENASSRPNMDFDRLMLSWRRGPFHDGLGNVDKIVVFDPMRRTKRQLMRRVVGRVEDLMRELGASDWGPGGLHEENRVGGYYFVVSEFPVDPSGKRTGAPGTDRILWRRVR